MALCFFCLATVSFTAAQTEFVGWFSSNYNVRLSKKTSIQGDITLRSSDQWKSAETFLFRPGLIVYFSKEWGVGLGYGLVYSEEESDNIRKFLPEHHVWEQLFWLHAVTIGSGSHSKQGNLFQRLRIENRFVPKVYTQNNTLKIHGTGFANRLRYLVRDITPLVPGSSFEKGPYLALQNELLINMSGQTYLNGRVLDQNRSYVGTGYRFSKKCDAELGYIYIYVEDGNHVFLHKHVMQVTTAWRL